MSQNPNTGAFEAGRYAMLLRWWPVCLLACMLFFTFAMTTESIGNILPQVIREFSISLTEASAFHYSTMIGLALSGLALGHLADRFGHRNTLVAGLGLYGLCCLLFLAGESYSFFVGLFFLGGIAIGIFKTAALSLIGDVTTDSDSHTRAMNFVEGFYAIGGIVGPALIGVMLANDVAWQYLYPLAAALCLLLLIASLAVSYPPTRHTIKQEAGIAETAAMLKDPYALCFGLALALYVAVEVAIYVWMPKLLEQYTGNLYDTALYALMIFFTLRALGRFAGPLVLRYLSWTTVMLWSTLGILLCYLSALFLGVSAAVVALPLSGLFMSMVYPTLNSKAISSFPKERHSSIAGLMLFFTAAAAAGGPLVMGIIGDLLGDIYYGFVFAALLAAALFLGMGYNHIRQPARHRLDSPGEYTPPR